MGWWKLKIQIKWHTWLFQFFSFSIHPKWKWKSIHFFNYERKNAKKMVNVDKYKYTSNASGNFNQLNVTLLLKPYLANNIARYWRNGMPHLWPFRYFAIIRRYQKVGRDKTAFFSISTFSSNHGSMLLILRKYWQRKIRFGLEDVSATSGSLTITWPVDFTCSMEFSSSVLQ